MKVVFSLGALLAVLAPDTMAIDGIRSDPAVEDEEHILCYGSRVLMKLVEMYKGIHWIKGGSCAITPN